MYSCLPLSAESSTPNHWPRVAESSRRSTATSNTAPRVQRTIFTSACGAFWKCMPRSVPFLWLKPTLSCVWFGFRPCAASVSRHQARAKKPRSSVIFFRSMTNRPCKVVGVNCICLLSLQADAFVAADAGLVVGTAPVDEHRRLRALHDQPGHFVEL